MKLNNILRLSSHSYLCEISRQNLVGKVKAQSPGRYNRRLGYRPLGDNEINVDNLLSDDLCALKTKVGKYDCIVAYKGVLKRLLQVVKKQPRPNVTLQSVIRALTQSIDDADILVDCSCPDFRYRYAYWATKLKYKYGKPETRPSNITNPDNNIGSMCKHLTALLANKKWLVKAASVVNEAIKANVDEVRKKLGVSEDEFIINVVGRPSKKTGRNIHMTQNTIPTNKDDEPTLTKKDLDKIPDPDVPDKMSDFKDEPDEDNDDEELEPRDPEEGDEE